MTEGSSRIDGFQRPPHRLLVYRPPADRKDSSICLEDESEQCVFRRPGTGYSPDVIAEFCFNRGLSCDRFAAVERRPNYLGNAYCSIGIRTIPDAGNGGMVEGW